MNRKLAALLGCVLAVVALAIGGMAGCGRSPLERAIDGVKELEPQAKERNEEIRELTGMPTEQDE